MYWYLNRWNSTSSSHNPTEHCVIVYARRVCVCASVRECFVRYDFKALHTAPRFAQCARGSVLITAANQLRYGVIVSQVQNVRKHAPYLRMCVCAIIIHFLVRLDLHVTAVQSRL